MSEPTEKVLMMTLPDSKGGVTVLVAAQPGPAYTKFCAAQWKVRYESYQKEKGRLLKGKQNYSTEFAELVWSHIAGCEKVAEWKIADNMPSKKETLNRVDWMIENRNEWMRHAKAQMKHNATLLKRQEEEILAKKYFGKKDDDNSGGNGGAPGMVF